MNTGIKYLIIGLSVISAAGIGYFIYSRVKISELNNRVSTLNEADSVIDSIDTSGIVIPADSSTEPDVPLYDNDGNDTENIIDTSFLYDYGYGYGYGYS